MVVGTEVGQFSFHEFYQRFETWILEEAIFNVGSLGEWYALQFLWGAAYNIDAVLGLGD